MFSSSSKHVDNIQKVFQDRGALVNHVKFHESEVVDGKKKGLVAV